MKLTPLQRYTMYCILSAEAANINRIDYGICYLIYDICGLQNNGYNQPHFDISKVINNYLPELAAKDTGKRYGVFEAYWFPNWAARREVIEQVIKETEPK